jgi:hypothetical protein
VFCLVLEENRDKITVASLALPDSWPPSCDSVSRPPVVQIPAEVPSASSSSGSLPAPRAGVDDLQLRPSPPFVLPVSLHPLRTAASRRCLGAYASPHQRWPPPLSSFFLCCFLHISDLCPPSARSLSQPCPTSRYSASLAYVQALPCL